MFVCAEIGKMECTDVGYHYCIGTRKCDDSCIAKARSEGSRYYKSSCHGTVPHMKCCCTVLPPVQAT